MGGARRGPEMPLKDDGWGWLMFGLGKVESGLDVMKYRVGCMKRGGQGIKRKRREVNINILYTCK